MGPKIRRRWDRVDLTMVALVRLTSEESWTARSAANQLRSRVPDREILRRARARVAATLAARPSIVGERVLATLDGALADMLSEPNRFAAPACTEGAPPEILREAGDVVGA